MKTLLSPDQFYDLALQQRGLVRIDEDERAVKLAEVHKESVEIVKLAQVYFEQLAKDQQVTLENGGEAWYDKPEVMADDAMKLAKAYYAHIEEAQKTAEENANRLLEKLAQAAEEWAKDAKYEGDPLELVKVAGLQAQSVLEMEERQNKIAAGDPIGSIHPSFDPATALNDPHQHVYVGAQGRQPFAIHLPTAKAALGHTMAPDLMKQKYQSEMSQAQGAVRAATAVNDPTAAATAKAELDRVNRFWNTRFHDTGHDALTRLSGTEYPARHQEFLHTMFNRSQASGDPFDKVFSDVYKGVRTPQGGPRQGVIPRVTNWMSANPMKSLGIGAAGLGALYMLKKRRDEQDQELELAHLRARQAQQGGQA